MAATLAERSLLVEDVRVACRASRSSRFFGAGLAGGDMLGEAPDTTAVASALVTVAGSGASGSLSTTLLLSIEEMLDALGQTRGIADRPPAADRTEPQPHRRRAPGQLGVSTLDLASLHPGSDPEGA